MEATALNKFTINLEQRGKHFLEGGRGSKKFLAPSSFWARYGTAKTKEKNYIFLECDNFLVLISDSELKSKQNNIF